MLVQKLNPVGPWTVVTQMQSGEVSVLRGLTATELLKLVQSYRSWPRPKGLPGSPWYKRAHEEAVRLCGPDELMELVKVHFNEPPKKYYGGSKWDGDDNRVSVFEAWSDNGDSLDDIFPIPDDLSNMILTGVKREMDYRVSFAEQFMEYLDGLKGVPWEYRKSFHYADGRGNFVCYAPKSKSYDEAADLTQRYFSYDE